MRGKGKIRSARCMYDRSVKEGVRVSIEIQHEMSSFGVRVDLCSWIRVTDARQSGQSLTHCLLSIDITRIIHTCNVKITDFKF